MAKIAIQGLGEDPTTVKVVLERENPDLTYILCSDFLLENVAKDAGYDEPNEAVVKKIAEKTGAKVVLKKCNVFDPKSVAEAMGEIIREVKPDDEVSINYSEGTATVKLVLGATAVVLLKSMKIRILYADAAGIIDHTDSLKGLFKLLYEFY
jgi:CRISPR/Cas system-associated protein Csx1